MEDGAALGRHVGAATLPLLGGSTLHQVRQVPVLQGCDSIDILKNKREILSVTCGFGKDT